jgi:hypothetical protein
MERERHALREEFGRRLADMEAGAGRDREQSERERDALREMHAKELARLTAEEASR